MPFLGVIVDTDQVGWITSEAVAAETAELLNRLGPAIFREPDIQKLVQIVTDTATRLVSAEFGSFFQNMLNERGESYMLYTLSGVPKDAFAAFPMPRNTDVFAPTFGGDGVVRSDDITKDPRYGLNEPYYGMPKGHLPVRSYLAVPVISRSGEVLGGLFFGHSTSGRFTRRHEDLVTGIAAHAAVALDNCRLFEQSQWAQAELQRTNDDLRRANRDLEVFSYSASHDLQEPLRNIALSAQLFKVQSGDRLDQEQAQFVDSILEGTQRMETLVRDLLSYTQAIRQTDGGVPHISAAAVAASTLAGLKNQIEQSGAVIEMSNLPTVVMHPGHLAQLFQNLIGNALKYRRSEPPRVHLSATQEDGWCVVSVEDNGIGIEPGYTEQIFGLFRRLHTYADFPGSGIGLAICQRIVEQYGGRIWVEKSAVGAGSVFSFAIPDRAK